MNELTIRNAKAQANLAAWGQIVADCRQSGLPVSQWCAEHNINTRTYYGWQKKVFANMVEQTEPRFVELPKLSGASKTVVATVHMGSASVDLYSDVSLDFATALCKALSHAE